MLKTLSPFGFPVLAVLIFSRIALADWTQLSSDDFTMAPPPEAGSAADVRDYETLHQLQEERTEAECDEARGQLNHSFKNLFGEQLTENQFARLQKLMNRAFKLTAAIGSDFKESYGRPRPYAADKSIKPCIPKLGAGRAYPSTHAALGIVGGCVLAEAIPKKAAKFRKSGERVGELRVIAGVHHPTDVEAGQKLGQDICDRLLQDDSFVAEIHP